MGNHVPENVPKHCPGTNNENAGKDKACAGCPNQTTCVALPKGPDPDLEEIASNLQNVDKRILILSGKGGVGKSSISCLLSMFLSSDSNKHVGLLDLDICGPSLPRMLGINNESFHQGYSGYMSPVYCGFHANTAVASVGFFIEEEAVVWRGPKKSGLIKSFLKNVDWDVQDYLIIDTPPGTSDEHINIVNFAKPIFGAIIITGPQELSWQDVRKEIDFCHKMNIRIIAIVINMLDFLCPSCHQVSTVYPSKRNEIIQFAKNNEVPVVSVPLNPFIAQSLDSGSLISIDTLPSEIQEPLKFIAELIS